MANRKTQSTPILELSTLAPRKRWITINGEEHTLHDPATMGVQHQAAVLHAAAEMSKLGARKAALSPADADQILELVTDAVMQVIEAPREVVVQLTLPQMMQIIEVFSSSADVAKPSRPKPRK